MSWREEINFQWDDDDDEVLFVLDQHAELDFYSASSLKRQVIFFCYPSTKMVHYNISQSNGIKIYPFIFAKNLLSSVDEL
jgi:hypothetical protein